MTVGLEYSKTCARVSGPLAAGLGHSVSYQIVNCQTNLSGLGNADRTSCKPNDIRRYHLERAVERAAPGYNIMGYGQIHRRFRLKSILALFCDPEHRAGYNDGIELLDD